LLHIIIPTPFCLLELESMISSTPDAVLWSPELCLLKHGASGEDEDDITVGQLYTLHSTQGCLKDT
jgi:hypothetical protein